MTTRRIALITALVVAVVAVAAGIGYVVWPRTTEYDRAVSRLPEQMQRVAFTNWRGLRTELGAEGLAPVGPQAEEFVSRAHDRDLSVSSLDSSAAQLHEAFGFTPVTSEWEMLGQSEEGMLVVLELDQDLTEVADRFEAQGFTRPSEGAMEGEVWKGGADVVASAGLATYELAHVAFLEDEGLLVGSDSAAYLEESMPVVEGEQDGLEVGSLTDRVDAPLAATAFFDGYACDELSMTRADQSAQQVADDLVEQAGGVSPLKGYLVALEADDRLSIVFGLENENQAEEDARSRRALAGAEDPGQMVDYSEVFSISETEQDGSTVVLRGEASTDRSPMTNLTSGPVLLASC